MRCVLIGNYGAGNLGDELLREYFLTAFPDIHWNTVGAKASREREVPRLPFGVRSLCTAWWKTIIAYLLADAVVFGGGTLFTDVESIQACHLWRWHARFARFLGKPVFLAFQGVGPFKTQAGEHCARGVIRHASFVSVRDEKSAERVGAWGVNAVQTADPVIALFDERRRGTGTALCLIPRDNSGPEFAQAVRNHLSNHTHSSIKIISMKPDDRKEKTVCAALAKEFSARVFPVNTLEETKKALDGCSHAISARFHGAIAAAGCGLSVTTVPLHPGDKLAAFESGSGARELLKRGEDALRAALAAVA